MKGISKKSIILTSIVILFNLVGLVGFAIPALQPVFLKLVPWHLLLMGIVVLLSHERFNEKFLLFFLLTYVITFFAEWAGVHSNWFFGDYSYGRTLGVRLWDIPLIMGINWFLLIYCAGVVMPYSRIKNTVARIIIGALLLVLLDVLIEPIAIKFDYWHWGNNIIPLKNYIGWFGLSVVMLFVFEKFDFPKQSMVAPVLLLMQFVFFGALHFL
jgi:putative membrane protein